MADWAGAAACAEGYASAWGKDAPGGAFVLFDRGGPHTAACGGLASLEHGVPFTADTPTRYASISKHFLAASLLLAGVDLDAPLVRLLGRLSFGGRGLDSVPLCRGLDMTGGLPDAMELLWQQGVPFTATLSADDITAALRNLWIDEAPPLGTEMAYSNTGWRLGQSVLEIHTGVPYADFLQARLFGPLGLPIRFPCDETEPVPGIAAGYWYDGSAWRRGRYGLHVSASGGLVGSAAALARWAGALLAGHGPLEGTLDRLLAPRPFADGTPSAYRLGLVEAQLGQTRLAMHSGSLPGYRNHLLVAPDFGVGVALLLNRDEDPLPPALDVMAALLGEAPPQPAAGLPPGLYAAAEGPYWAELSPDAIEFMGAREALYGDGEGGYRSFPSTLEVAFRVQGNALEGRFGGAARRLVRVPDGLALDPRLVGHWRNSQSRAKLDIRSDGTALWPWAASVGREVQLVPLPGARAVASLTHLMWRHRPCLWPRPGGTMGLAGHRARVLGFHRLSGTSGR